MSISVTVQQIQVTCVRLSGPGSRRYESITHIGAGGRMWSKAEAIAALKTGRISFYTAVNGRVALVGIYGQNGVEYLRTYSDGYPDNNLENLRDC